VVDDDLVTLLLLRDALEGAGFHVEQAENGRQALEMFERVRPSLITLDIMMPELDGFATCSELRRRPAGAQVPILMITGLDDYEPIHQAFMAGATDFITKPINFTLLEYRIRYLLRASAAMARLHESKERIRQLAFIDSLTQLPNRELFKDRLDTMLKLAKRHGRQLGLLFLDLDNFKRINDTLGHCVGDLLLQAMAGRLKKSLRTSDSASRNGMDEQDESVARLGGDEFTVLLPEIQRSEDAALVAERIQASLSQPLTLGEHEVLITPSIGIAVFPQDGEDAETLLKNADTAMYFAKRQGRNLYRFYNVALNESALKRLTMESQLRKAVERNELALHYQPQLDLLRGRICGVEALLRWTNGLLGPVSPLEFIPLAEETGLIISIGTWVLRTACQQAKDWQVAGIRPERMAVNISVLQFVQPGFTELVAAILKEHDLEPAVLELEITESLLMKDPEGALHTLRTLKNLGVQLAIDDFGTGYSSLSRLKQFPLDRLKIDKAFVREVNSQPNDAAIATAVIAMADSMGLRVIAEGVENEAQLRFLESKRCDEIQGYYLSRPLSSADMTMLLNSQPSCADDG